jgi:hypothetical protein
LNNLLGSESQNQISKPSSTANFILEDVLRKLNFDNMDAIFFNWSDLFVLCNFLEYKLLLQNFLSVIPHQ